MKVLKTETVVVKETVNWSDPPKWAAVGRTSKTVKAVFALKEHSDFFCESMSKNGFRVEVIEIEGSIED